MNKIVSLALAVSCCSLFPSCDTETPETRFDVAVLNCNLMHGFAGSGLRRELESPSVKLTDTKTGASAPMKRKEVIEGKIQSLETNLGKVRNLKQSEDSREMLQASIALHEYVLPVYKNEYQQLAKLYDDGTAQEKIQSLAAAIETQYQPGFKTLFDRLTAAGKPYAERHHINVKWDVATEPSF